MKTIRVNASRAYDVHVGSGLLESIGMLVKNASAASACVLVSDTHVYPLYGEAVRAQLTDAGFTVYEPFVFPAGEQNKCGSTYLSLLNHLATCSLTRTDCILALGGGVVGDLAGFAAATYLRGIDYVQIPTTLLAAVDSSVGGKTAIDLEAGKNLAGAFYQPKLVVCDTDTLRTLPSSVFRDGCAEVIKYGILYDEALFAHLAGHGLDFDREAVIARCVELKRDVVALDEFDRGERMKLNLGHTVGHGVEACSGYAISHGRAVAIGMAVMTRAAEKAGICSADTKQAVLQVLDTFGLETTTVYSVRQLYQCALSDKKRSAGTVNLIIPERIGFCRIAPTPVEQVKSLVEAGL